VEVSAVSKDDIVLVSGQGVIGFFFAQWARMRGARVVALEPDPKRSDMARSLADIIVIDPTQGDLDENILVACGEGTRFLDGFE
jgi:threonine dehydrogenase-like Zn-dependent dehydrogenase